jgi:hypothetical protein
MSTSIVEVDRRPDELFGYVTDPTRFAESQNGVVAGHTEPGGAPAVGDRCFMTRRISTCDLSRNRVARVWSPGLAPL